MITKIPAWPEPTNRDKTKVAATLSNNNTVDMSDFNKVFKKPPTGGKGFKDGE